MLLGLDDVQAMFKQSIAQSWFQTFSHLAMLRVTAREHQANNRVEEHKPVTRLEMMDGNIMTKGN